MFNPLATNGTKCPEPLLITLEHHRTPKAPNSHRCLEIHISLTPRSRHCLSLRISPTLKSLRCMSLLTNLTKRYSRRARIVEKRRARSCLDAPRELCTLV